MLIHEAFRSQPSLTMLPLVRQVRPSKSGPPDYARSHSWAPLIAERSREKSTTTYHRRFEGDVSHQNRNFRPSCMYLAVLAEVILPICELEALLFGCP